MGLRTALGFKTKKQVEAIPNLAVAPLTGRELALNRGKERWRSFKRIVHSVDAKSLNDRVLDVGCGRGDFVIAALAEGVCAFGLDVSVNGIDIFKSSAPAGKTDVCVAYDGTIFPYENQTFSAVHCWFVFEHLPKPHETIREISRVAKKGCILVLDAQDGRTQFEAHAKIPWMPFLPRPLRDAWLAALTTEERRDYVANCVFDTTGEEVRCALTLFGWKIEKYEAGNVALQNSLRPPKNVDEASDTAKQALALSLGGEWPSTPTNYHIIARKVGS